MKTALLLSGGMDSLCVAWWLRPHIAITLDYGQLAAAAEIQASTLIAHELGMQHIVIRVDCRSLGSGDMAGSAASSLAPASEWWPFRNQLLITLAAMKVASLHVSRLLIGTVASDCGHADGQPEFVERMNAVLSYQEGALQLEAPAIGMTTAELARKCDVPLSFLAWAHSCHKSDVACGDCRGCNKYFEVLRELDPELE